MKKTYLYYISQIFFILLLSIMHNKSDAQWLSEMQLSQGGISYNNTKNIAVNSNSVHLIVFDFYNNDTYRILYKRSDDEGVNWGNSMVIVSSNNVIQNPSIAVSNDIIHVIWEDSRHNNNEIYYIRSTNNGTTWENEIRLTNDINITRTPSLVANGSYVNIVFSDHRNNQKQIYYKRSTNDGITWEAEFPISDNPAFPSLEFPCITTSGSFIHVAWVDSRNDQREIFYNRSSNNGSTWEKNIRLSDSAIHCMYPNIAASGSNVHLVWEDYWPGFREIYYKRSLDNGTTWNENRQIINVSAQASSAVLSASSSFIHIAFYDRRETMYYQSYYKRSIDNGTNWENDIMLSNGINLSYPSTLALYGLRLYYIFGSQRQTQSYIYLRINPTGNTVNINNISSKLPEQFSLYQNYPNPFNPATKIKFAIAQPGFVQLKVFDMLGKEIAALANENLNAGMYEVNWNAVNFPSGVYYYKLISGNFTEVKKMILIK